MGIGTDGRRGVASSSARRAAEPLSSKASANGVNCFVVSGSGGGATSVLSVGSRGGGGAAAAASARKASAAAAPARRAASPKRASLARRANASRSGYLSFRKKSTSARLFSESMGGAWPFAVSSTSPSRTPAPAARLAGWTASTVQSAPRSLRASEQPMGGSGTITSMTSVDCIIRRLSGAS